MKSIWPDFKLLAYYSFLPNCSWLSFATQKDKRQSSRSFHICNFKYNKNYEKLLFNWNLFWNGQNIVDLIVVILNHVHLGDTVAPMSLTESFLRFFAISSRKCNFHEDTGMLCKCKLKSDIHQTLPGSFKKSEFWMWK